MCWQARLTVHSEAVTSYLTCEMRGIALPLFSSSHSHIYTECIFVFRLLETETTCPMCSEALSVKQVKKITDCSKYLQAEDLDQ